MLMGLCVLACVCVNLYKRVCVCVPVLVCVSVCVFELACVSLCYCVFMLVMCVRVCWYVWVSLC